MTWLQTRVEHVIDIAQQVTGTPWTEVDCTTGIDLQIESQAKGFADERKGDQETQAKVRGAGDKTAERRR